MEIYQLRTFAAVAELGSLARATQKLHVSMPAASSHIKALENELGVVLFDRRPIGLCLTRAGAALLPRVQRVLVAAAEVASEAKQLQGQVSGRFRFAAVFDPDLLRLGELMSRLIERHPMLEIELHHRNSRNVTAGVASGDYDAGIALGDAEAPGVSTVVLRRLNYKIVAPGAWADRLKNADWATIAELPWISAPRGGSHHAMAEHLFRRHRFTPVKVLEADSESIITSLVFAGVGVGLMREDLARTAAEQNRAIVLERGTASTLLRLLYVTARESEPGIRAVRDVIRELWAQSATGVT